MSCVSMCDIAVGVAERECGFVTAVILRRGRGRNLQEIRKDLYEAKHRSNANANGDSLLSLYISELLHTAQFLYWCSAGIKGASGDVTPRIIRKNAIPAHPVRDIYDDGFNIICQSRTSCSVSCAVVSSLRRERQQARLKYFVEVQHSDSPEPRERVLIRKRQ